MNPRVFWALLLVGGGVLLGAVFNMLSSSFDPGLIHVLGLGAFITGTIGLRRQQVSAMASGPPLAPQTSSARETHPRDPPITDFSSSDEPQQPKARTSARRGWHQRLRGGSSDTTAQPHDSSASSPGRSGRGPVRSHLSGRALPLSLPTLPRGRVVTGAPLALSLDLQGSVEGELEAVLEQGGRAQRVSAPAGHGATMLSLPAPEPGPATIRVRLMVDGVCVGETLLEVHAQPPQELVTDLFDDARDALVTGGVDLPPRPTPREVLVALETRSGARLESVRRVLEQATYDEVPPDPHAFSEAVQRVHAAVARVRDAA